MWHGLRGMPRGLDLGSMPGGTLLFVLLLVYNSVSTKLAKSTKKGANFY